MPTTDKPLNFWSQVDWITIILYIGLMAFGWISICGASYTYGENDIIWYTEQGGRRPHAAAACLVLYGDENARLNVPENFSLEERAEAAEDMLADVLESAA